MYVDCKYVCRPEQVTTTGPVVTADTGRSVVMVMVTVATALVIRDPMIETGDLVAGTDTRTLGPAGRLARTAVNQHPRETEKDERLMVLVSETEGMTDL